jgi:predicted translin family RNA/ssDNA-binding protein
MKIEELRAQLPLLVTDEDFLLGVADLTGEVMRCAPVYHGILYRD